MLILYRLGGFAPFGTLSLAWMDANIQYLDFFSYLKDVLAGNNDIAYTFSKSLGGSNVAVFSYYLSSPLNLLVVFFDKAELHTFFDLLAALKLSLAAFTFSVFLSNYFESGTDAAPHRNWAVVLLSVSYSLCQYCTAQSSNIMWLDGVYMLPLILLGVHQTVQGKSSWQLSVSVCLSILFNWYSGGINCLFSILWAFFELVMAQSEKGPRPLGRIAKESAAFIVRYGIAMAIGVLLSCFLFLPTVFAMQSSSKGSLRFSTLMDLYFMGDISSVIQGYTLGAKSSQSSVSLFCGSFALLGCLGCFFSKGIPPKKKVILGALLGLAVLLFYWHPLYVVFSLFKDVYSYWSRYSYVGIVVILFLAAHFYLTGRYQSVKILPILLAAAFSSALLVLNRLKPSADTDLTYASVLFLIAIACAMVLADFCSRRKRPARVCTRGIAAALIICELAFGASLQMKNYHVSDVAAYQAYTPAAQAQIDALQDFDSGVYRVSQTSTRGTGSTNLNANYNEALAFDYWSIAGYSSAPEGLQNLFLDRLGYRQGDVAMCIVNTSILPADSLLGVKYVLSEYPITGLEEIKSLGSFNHKSVYQNPYALPWAFRCQSSGITPDAAANPFEYQNQLYSQLVGEEVELYIPLRFEILQEGNIQQGESLLYSIELPEGNYAFYGNLPWKTELNAVLTVNGTYKTGYSRWLSPSVFYIPCSEGDAAATIEVTSGTSYDLKYGEEQFYALDLDKLAEVTAQLSSQEAESIHVGNGTVTIETTASAGEWLYLSVPYDKSWTMTLNGREIEPELFGECMYLIALEEGTNEIEMVYHVQGLWMGIAVSLAGLAALLIVRMLEQKHWKPRLILALDKKV